MRLRPTCICVSPTVRITDRRPQCGPTPLVVFQSAATELSSDGHATLRGGYIFRETRKFATHAPPFFKGKASSFRAKKQFRKRFKNSVLQFSDPDLAQIPPPTYHHQRATLTISDLHVSYFIFLTIFSSLFPTRCHAGCC